MSAKRFCNREAHGFERCEVAYLWPSINGCGCVRFSLREQFAYFRKYSVFPGRSQMKRGPRVSDAGMTSPRPTPKSERAPTTEADEEGTDA